jgi:protein-disulfide isomerase
MASRKEAKEEARAKRLADEQARAAQTQRTRRIQMLAGVVIAAVAIVVVAIAVSSGGSSAKPGPPKGSKAQAALTDTISSLLTGIPESGTELGNPNAPVTMTYFGDLECPICAEFTTGANDSGGGFSQTVSTLVRAGKVKVIYRSFCTATCNDYSNGQDIFNSQQAAAYSAGQQKKFWWYAEYFYREQGAEGSGYVTPTFLNKLAAQVSGLDYNTWQTDRKDPIVTEQVTSDQHLAAKDGLTGTPTVIMTGPKGKEEPGAGSVPTFSEIDQAYNQVA